MNSFLYSKKSLKGDYARGIIGIIVTGGLLIAATKITIFQYFFAGSAILFFGFFLRTAQRHLTIFLISDEIFHAKGPFGRIIYWLEVTEIRLRYFSTRRERNGNGGWFELTIKDFNSSISIDSSLTGFDDILPICAKFIKENKIIVTETTVENFSSTGLTLDRDFTPAAAPPKKPNSL